MDFRRPCSVKRLEYGLIWDYALVAALEMELQQNRAIAKKTRRPVIGIADRYDATEVIKDSFGTC